MKIDQKAFASQLQAILDEDVIGIVELANKTAISRETIYSLLACERPNVQRRTIREIAAATGRDVHISGEKVTFTKKEKKPESRLSPLAQELLAKFDELGDGQQRNVLELVDSIWKAMKMKDVEGEKNS
jgi:DNA-binding phage protein